MVGGAGRPGGNSDERGLVPVELWMERASGGRCGKDAQCAALADVEGGGRCVNLQVTKPGSLTTYQGGACCCAHHGSLQRSQAHGWCTGGAGGDGRQRGQPVIHILNNTGQCRKLGAGKWQRAKAAVGSSSCGGNGGRTRAVNGHLWMLAAGAKAGARGGDRCRWRCTSGPAVVAWALPAVPATAKWAAGWRGDQAVKAGLRVRVAGLLPSVVAVVGIDAEGTKHCDDCGQRG